MFVGCDTGGTFTDFVMYDPAQPQQGLSTLKLSSTPDDPSRAVLEGLSRLCGSGVAQQVNHGTTVATNALLEKTGGRVAFFTTQGFEEMLWLGRGQRDELYALSPSRREPPLRRNDCFSVKGRLDALGAEISPFEGLAIESSEQDAAAVCLLHSSINPDHELALAELLRERFPRLFLSHQLAPGSGEFERGMTTLLAAYLAPKVEGYLERLSQALPDSQLRIVHSAGGLLSCREAQEQPQRLALSGPAAGLRGALSVAEACGESNLVTLDMGGTSTDVALLVQGQLPYAWSTEVEGFPLRGPTLEIHTIGAGGGSLAQVDQSGLLRVGPKSAGASPGPACYGRGGCEATVTDALCWNGYLPETLGNEDWRIDLEPCRRAIAALAQRLGLPEAQTADGILEVAANHLAQAVRKVTTARGHDPSTCCLFPFGGAGPMLACLTAELLEMNRVLVPDKAGVLSAWGALTAPWEREWSAVLSPSERENPADWQRRIQCLESEVREQQTLGENLSWLRLVARRYKGQGETLVSEPQRDFHEVHREYFGFSRPGTPVQATEVRLRAQAPPLPQPTGSQPESQGEKRKRRLRWKGEEISVALSSEFQEALGPGPTLLFQESSTLFIPPNWNARVVGERHLLLERSSE